MPAARSKLAVVVRGGWDGHSPVEATNLFIPHLEANGFEVRIFDSPAPYADAALMAQTALIVQCNTMSTIERDQVRGLKQAIQNGTGMAGWHGGIADSYRESSEYLHLIGAQFAEHPSLYDPATDTTKGPERNYVSYTVNMLPEARRPPDHAGALGLRARHGAVLGPLGSLSRRARDDDAAGPAVGSVETGGHLARDLDAAMGRGTHLRLHAGAQPGRARAPDGPDSR